MGYYICNILVEKKINSTGVTFFPINYQNSNPNNMHISNLCTIDLQTTSSYLENCRMNYLYNRNSLYAVFCKKMISWTAGIFSLITKTHVIFTALIYVQLILKTTISDLETEEGVIRTIGVLYMQYSTAGIFF